MVRRLIGFIVILALLLIFIGVNLSNTAKISLIFKTFDEAPVYLIAFVSFLLGMLVSVPFLVSFALKKGKPKAKKGKDEAEALPSDAAADHQAGALE
jgi:uncharacterized integral membrane protein